MRAGVELVGVSVAIEVAIPVGASVAITPKSGRGNFVGSE
jgi:hypothetical protein